jgi:hypothetical protein
MIKCRILYSVEIWEWISLKWLKDQFHFLQIGTAWYCHHSSVREAVYLQCFRKKIPCSFYCSPIHCCSQ